MITRIFVLACDIYLLGLIVLAVASWVQHPTAYAVCRALNPFYEPFLRPIRERLRAFQAGGMQIDLSPVVLFIAVIVVRELVVGLLFRIL
ncbi:MAG TPA: YggT family protein [Candidatus Hydrogenedentes bacterium]|nr:YggT family protein [Candidatus Hydrogenedentota bacterium]HNT88725.1 YggT family protein [Candidatus Hydrogenedentota bacterium]